MKVIDFPRGRYWSEYMHKENHLQTCLGVEIMLFVVGIAHGAAPP